MNILVYLLPAALFLGLLWLGVFLWSLKSGQYDDLDGAAERILFDDEEAPPPPDGARSRAKPKA
jgi:cbb3-type cytochrome oxidase maturation protein